LITRDEKTTNINEINLTVMKKKDRIWIYPLSTIVIFLMFLSISCKNAVKESTEGVKDIDGNVYDTVTIGTQVWMKENLKTTKYSNNDLIGTTTSATLNISSETSPKYQWAYEGNERNVATYGRLYTWFAVTDNRNVCPTGWHVPSYEEWGTLTRYFGGENVAGYKLKETGTTHWHEGWADATNYETDFIALPGGLRGNDGTFDQIGYTGYWWSTTEFDATEAYNFAMYFFNSMAVSLNSNQREGFSVRCLKD
jgi:uncharacterized protein (TIGR02145 family)